MKDGGVLINKWDRYFLDMAKHVSSISKDQSTKTGAVIVGSIREVISTGFNGFPIGIDDAIERYTSRKTKYQYILHAEENAIVFARRELTYCTLYTYPFQSCSKCARLLIQSGIERVVAPKTPTRLVSRWGKDIELATKMFAEAGVQVDIVDYENKGG